MDDFEAMMERARVRREALKEKLKEATTPSAPVKRQVDNLVNRENFCPASVNSCEDDDSPSKRCCLNSEWSGNSSPIRSAVAFSPKSKSPCRERLAALARDRVEWEDDMRSPSLNSRQESDETVAEQNCKHQSCSSVARTDSVKADPLCNSDNNVATSANKKSTVARNNSNKLQKFGSSKTDIEINHYPVEGELSTPVRCTGSSATTGLQQSSSVGLSGTTNGSAVGKQSSVTNKKFCQSAIKMGTYVTPGKTSYTSANCKKEVVNAVSKLGAKENQLCAVASSEATVESSGSLMHSMSKSTLSENIDQSCTSSVKSHVEKFANADRQESDRRQSDVNEPTKQPVSARMAAWKKKLAGSESDAEVTSLNQKGMKNVTKSTRATCTQGTNVELLSTGNVQKPNTTPGLKPGSALPGSDKEMVTKSNKLPLVDSSSPLREGETRQRTLPQPGTTVAQPVKPSPKKLGAATLGIQEKLSAMCDSWKKNEIAEKNRQERASEMALLENRWKNGVLVDNEPPAVCTAKVSSCLTTVTTSNSNAVLPIPSEPPKAPPLPADWSASKPTASFSSQNKSSISQEGGRHVLTTKPVASPVTCKKISPTQSVTSSLDSGKTKKSTSVACEADESLAGQVASILESNLLAMGFEKSSGGAVATISDQSPLRDSCRQASSTIRTPSSVAKNDAKKTEELAAKLYSPQILGKLTPESLASSRPPSVPVQSSTFYGYVREQAKILKTSGSNIASCPSVSEPDSEAQVSLNGKNLAESSKAHRDPLVYFCLSKNTFLSASSADEESMCSEQEVDGTLVKQGEEDSVSEDCDSTIESVEHELSNSDDDDDSENSMVTLKGTNSEIGDDTAQCETHSIHSTRKSVARCPIKRAAATANRLVSKQYSYRNRKPLKSGDRKARYVDTSSSSSSDVSLTASPTDDTRNLDATIEWNRRTYPQQRVVGLPFSPCGNVPLNPTAPPLSTDCSSCDEGPASCWRQVGSLNSRVRERQQNAPASSPYRSEQRLMNTTPRSPASRQQHTAQRPEQIQQMTNTHSRTSTTISLSVKDIQSRIQGLKQMAEEEEQVQLQASNALSHCIRTAPSSFVGSSEAVECHRLLLLAEKKRECFLTEAKRLREAQGAVKVSDSLGCLIARNIKLPLKPEFMAKLGTPQDTSIHYFVVLLRNGVNMVAAQKVSTQESMLLGCLNVLGEIRLNGVPCDFSPSVCMEIYAMCVSRDPVQAMTPKKTSKMNRKGNDERQPSVQSTSFVLVAQLQLSLDSLTRTHFPLTGVAYACPLQGTIHVKLTLEPETTVFCRGFLNVYSDELSDGWNRFWCMLCNDRLMMWNHPTAELYKNPVRSIDLRHCITKKAVAGCFGSSTSPTCFELVTVWQAAGNGGAVHNSYSITPVRHWLMADSVDECKLWCSRFNRVLDDLRAWDPYSLPSVTTS